MPRGPASFGAGVTQRVLRSAGIAVTAALLALGAASCSAGTGFPGGGAISIDQAQESVQAFLNSTGDQDLKIDELMEFQDNFYALIKEKSTGIGAFELLVSKGNGSVGFEPGPNMMWNTRYSPMTGGMMGRMRGGPFRIGPTAGTMTVGSDQATSIAQAWLDQNLAGDSAGTPDAFYGYYTFHFERSGQIAGMLSVNGYTGQVWYHTWHGAFIRAEDFGA